MSRGALQVGAEFIAESVHGLDGIKVGVEFGKAAAEAFDAGIDAAVGDDVIAGVEAVDQIVAREDAGGVADEAFEESEFGAGEGEGAAGEGGGEGFAIDGERAVNEAAGGVAGGRG